MTFALFFGVAATLIMMVSVRISSGYLFWDWVMVTYWIGVFLLLTGVGYVVQPT